MKPIHFISIIGVLCFALLSIVTITIYMDDKETVEKMDEGTREQLAMDLDNALGYEPLELDERDVATDKEQTAEDKNDQLVDGRKEEAEEEPLERKEQTVTPSQAIYLSTEEGTISIDTLLELIEGS
ncbi:hypothetical protein ACFPTR_11475 [Aliibacillus thermotolerans]|mgnify:FL=1|uniref:Uncharacterized protein n=1 Tax=Aliibacillus thermotolerans TaxID=1834418 RepID=A0ABW0U7K0_9BACI|nr:hypothetical protein [Aliibacillus thermotolerans]MDA3129798.1 hypothetical protein [Aliibacillus thermotolerans]